MSTKTQTIITPQWQFSAYNDNNIATTNQIVSDKLNQVKNELESLPLLYQVLERPLKQKNFLLVALGVVDNNGLSPLHHSAAHGAKKFISFLLEIVSTFHPNLPSENLQSMVDRREPTRGRTPLHLAVINKQLDAVTTLIEEAGASVKLTDFDGQSALHFAVQNNQFEMVELLLQLGADPNQQNLEGAGPLHIAAALGNMQIMELLLQNGAFIAIKDEEGDTPLVYAVRECKYDVVMALMKKCSGLETMKNEDGENAIEIANEIGDSKMYQLLNNNNNNNFNFSPMYQALDNDADMDM